MTRFIIVALTMMLFTVSSVFADVKAINVEELKELRKISIRIIDIRTKEDIKRTGIIPGSYRLSFYKPDGKIDRKKWLRSFVGLVQGKQIKFVLISADGKKAKLGSEILMDQKGYKNPHYLKGGIQAWLDANEKVQMIK